MLERVTDESRFGRVLHVVTTTSWLRSTALVLLVIPATAILPGCARTRVAALSARAQVTGRGSDGTQEVFWSGRTAKKVVALTFDDGPDPRYTPTVLDIARKQKVKFTFFVLGREVERHPDLARRIVAEGHAIGNHGWDHKLMTDGSERQKVDEIERCAQAVEKVCEQQTTLFRPPKGQWDGETLLSLQDLGYRMVLWTIPLEHRSAPTPEAMAKRIVDRVSPGMIVLAHDGEPHPPLNRKRTVAALPLLIDGLRKKGYEFVTVPELLEQVNEDPHPARVASRKR